MYAPQTQEEHEAKYRTLRRKETFKEANERLNNEAAKAAFDRARDSYPPQNIKSDNYKQPWTPRQDVGPTGILRSDSITDRCNGGSSVYRIHDVPKRFARP